MSIGHSHFEALINFISFEMFQQAQQVAAQQQQTAQVIQASSTPVIQSQATPVIQSPPNSQPQNVINILPAVSTQGHEGHEIHETCYSATFHFMEKT